MERGLKEGAPPDKEIYEDDHHDSSDGAHSGDQIFHDEGDNVQSDEMGGAR